MGRKGAGKGEKRCREWGEKVQGMGMINEGKGVGNGEKRCREGVLSTK